MSFRWGIIGCGGIAHAFARGIQSLPGTELVAVASKSLRRAQDFGLEHSVPQAYGDYEEMLTSESLDAVYIATTHNFHYENAKLCLNHGHSVLCEKAFTVNAKQAAELIALARTKNLFLMEAMWTRFLPCIVKLRELLADGAIGDVTHLKASFGIRTKKLLPWQRMRSKKLAGGALLDLGIYPVSFARMVFGRPPAEITSRAKIGWTGVDETSEYFFSYPNGARAELFASFRKAVPHDAVLTGTKGSIHIPNFFHPHRMTITRHGAAPETLEIPYAPTGYQYEAVEVAACLNDGRIESAVMPLAETIEIMRTLDTLRAQWKMKYPGE
ncbi:MAG: Gfo/Idh/MocA family oxidoreductase [Kiritimatiellaceae bacterium]|nr:Gfo/Idh/MocA family oxidoreductase [Kiritimatiellaceae bacterium]